MGFIMPPTCHHVPTDGSMMSRHLSYTPRWRPKSEIEWHRRHVGLVNDLILIILKYAFSFLVERNYYLPFFNKQNCVSSIELNERLRPEKDTSNSFIAFIGIRVGILSWSINALLIPTNVADV